MTDGNDDRPAKLLAPGRFRLPTLPEGFGEALWLLAVMRVALGLLALFIIARSSVPGSCHYELAFDHWSTSPPLANSWPEFPVVGVWQRWDACWYSKIATFGYEIGEDSPSFWPAMPALMRLVSAPFGGDVALSGLIVSSIAYVVAMAGLYRLVKSDFDETIARHTVLFITIAPAGLFLFAPFTESLFLATTIWALIAARNRSWGLAAVCALAAGLTRTQGILLALPIAWEAFCAWRERRTAAGRVLPSPRSILAMAAPAVGFASFVMATSILVGRSPMETQDVWGGRNFHWPWEVVDAAVRWIIVRHDSLEALNLGMLLLFMVLLIGGLRRLPVTYSLFALPQLAVIAIRLQPTPLTSTTRYLEVIFPAFVMLALVMDGRRRTTTWAIVSALTLGALTWLFVKGDWVA
jgi:hypothetical protein